jgi:hypothetical protein
MLDRESLVSQRIVEVPRSVQPSSLERFVDERLVAAAQND